MSTLAEARAGLVAALNTVDGVKGYTSPPDAPHTGDAWCRWEATRDQDSGGFDVTWSIVIVTPQDEKTADTWVDARIGDLLAALRPVTYVTGYAPANLNTPSSPVYGLLITSTRE